MNELILRKGIDRTEAIVRGCVLGACELFTLFTLVTKNYSGINEGLLLNLATFVILLLPEIIERVLRCKVSQTIYIFGVFYALGPLLGNNYKLYYLTSWWDKLLHLTGGIMFAILGFFIFQLLCKKDKQKVLACAVFALCFSIALAAVWEFFEFGCDVFFGMDMQQDRVVSDVRSYLLGQEVGTVGVIENITDVTVNGKQIPIKGYLDIGLFDTMGDMLIESVGAVLACAVLLIDKGRHQPIVIRNKEKNEES